MEVANILAVDCGGTFTDFVLLQDHCIHTHKVLSTPEAPEKAVWQGIVDLGLEQSARKGELRVIHGTTIATNAVLENKGVDTAFITHHGLADLLTIGRQNRNHLYQLQQPPPAIPVKREWCFETGGRLDANGEPLEPFSDDDINQLVTKVSASGVSAASITFLFSYLNPEMEIRVEKALEQAGVHTSRSSWVLPQSGEYERGIATWLNARLGPLVQEYFQRLEKLLGPSPLTIMMSYGGSLSAELAGKRAVNLLLSGPAGGLRGTEYLSRYLDNTNFLTFDMGGTSTDVALVKGNASITSHSKLAGYPVAVPTLDLHTIGAGGGSIAYVDQGGLLQVGPESAGSNPGPACYGKGGIQPTVTDANLFLGRIPEFQALGGYLKLDRAAAEVALHSLADKLNIDVRETAEGIIQLANQHMVQALRVISVERGHDPADYLLCCFGGAGGLHLCELAAELGVKGALVPVHGGVFSALGMLVTPAEIHVSRGIMKPFNDNLDAFISDTIDSLLNDAEREMLSSGIPPGHCETLVSLDLCYQGQGFTLNVPWKNIDETSQLFHQEHRQRFGHDFDTSIELVNIHLGLREQGKTIDLPQWQAPQQNHPPVEKGGHRIYQRNHLEQGQTVTGPALICESTATTRIAEKWQAVVDKVGNLIITPETS
jgi:N-methylhydantoinase A